MIFRSERCKSSMFHTFAMTTLEFKLNLTCGHFPIENVSSRRLVNKVLVRAFYCTKLVGISNTCSGLYDVAIICQFF